MKEKAKDNELMEKIVSLCKRRGFVYQGSEIYGGLAGTWDYGPYGVAIKENIKCLWWRRFVYNREDMYGIDAAILMNGRVWEAVGHVANFADPLDGKKFNTMLKTEVGAKKDEVAVSYLRPETAQGMFVNFKNIVDSFHPKLPFGLAQIGKAFRNEIAPRDFLFRVREFEQMEIEYFVSPADWEKSFNELRDESMSYLADLGIKKEKIHQLEVADGDRAHYSKRTVDIEYDYPFGRKELFGIAYRTDFDLTNHTKMSGVDLSYLDEESETRFIPHVIEPSMGVDRLVQAILCEAYAEDELGGEKRIFLKLSPKVAPVKVAVFPLLKNKPVLVEKAKQIYKNLKKEFDHVEFDDNGNVGKRYRRQDEIGTPFCVTVDFDTVEKDDTVTVRDRDSGKQERVAVKKLTDYLKNKLI